MSNDIFDDNAASWWDINGPYKTLHHINPTRLNYIKRYANLTDQQVLDIGCGGGILSEALAKNKANVVGIDISRQLIDIAKLHLYESNLTIDYQCIDIDNFAINHQQSFNVIVCMEMLEHVNDPNHIIKHCSSLLKQGGTLILSTLNRTLKSYVFNVLIAEYLCNLIPKGTHNYKQFITPALLCQMLRNANFNIINISGIKYNPFTKHANIINHPDINYLIVAKKL